MNSEDVKVPIHYSFLLLTSDTPPYRFATLSTSPSRGRLPGDQNGREGAALGGGPQNGSPSGATEPMGYGGGGFSGGGGGWNGRADERATLQEQLNELDEAASYVTTTEQSDGIERQRKPLIEQLRRMDEEEGKSGVYTAGDRLKNAGANAKLSEIVKRFAKVNISDKQTNAP